MCPLRLILIFLSATLAAFFVIRNLRSQPTPTQLDDIDDSSPTPTSQSDSSNPSSNATSKVPVAIQSWFWTLVDMATGRYLWSHLTSSSSSSSKRSI